MNKTFLVGSLFDCRCLENSKAKKYNSIFQQTVFGCKIMSLLQDMFSFNVEYVIQNDTFDLAKEIIAYNNQSVDMFARPMSLRGDVVDLAHPLHSMSDWNFGFTIYRPEVLGSERNFYSKPFTTSLWHCLNAMGLFCSFLFYLFKLCEIRLVAGVQWEHSFGYELLMVIGAYCQHIPPVDAVLYSRRGAYFAFFLFAYLIFTYYTSNLLSHIVNDKDGDINADDILNSEFETVILEDVKWIIWNNIAAVHANLSTSLMKLFHLKSVSICEGLIGLKSGKVALLSDYFTLEPFLSTVFKNYETCGLTNIDMSAKIKKYFFVSNEFPYQEEFRVALLRMQETGIIKRLDLYNNGFYKECVPPPHAQTQFHQILSPLCLLLGTYVLCVVMLLGEIVYYRKNRLWPYVE